MDNKQKKTYALVGNWHYIPGPRGYSVFSYDTDTADMQLIETVLDDVFAGQQYIDNDRGIAYVVDEKGDLRGQVGGGGYVMALRIDPETGHPSLINEKKSLSNTPSYFCMDKTKKYALIVHFSGFGYVTKIIKTENGAYDTETVFDDTAVVLFRIQDDGSLGDACDYHLIHGDIGDPPHRFPHLHSIVADPTGELFLACDKGLDKIFSFGLDRENGKLKLLSETTVETGVKPRYGVFHPTIPVYYSNHETSTDIYTFSYDVKTGVLQKMAATSLQTEENKGKPSEAADIVIDASGKHLYVSDRGSHMICVFDIDEKGELLLKQNIPSGGENPRGFSFSPDHKYFIVANSDTASLAVFSVQEDGQLTLLKNDIAAVCPANIRFAQF